MPRVNFFELTVELPERAARFYREAFEWEVEEFSEQEGYWLVITREGESGIDGAFRKRTGPARPVVCHLEVPSVDEFVARVTRNGGKLVKARSAVPMVGYLAYVQDTEGNVFGLMERDASVE
jgi:predicted enzyme related to lactoylglutathione lyase